MPTGSGSSLVGQPPLTDGVDYTATLPRKRLAAAVLFTDTSLTQRVLLLEPTYKADWTIPGGTVEEGESPWTAARREVREELGLQLGPVPGRLVAVDWIPAQHGRTEGLNILFDGGVLRSTQVAEIQLAEDELRGYTFCTREQAQQKLSPPVGRRITACMVAIDTGTTIYLENGNIL